MTKMTAANVTKAAKAEIVKQEERYTKALAAFEAAQDPDTAKDAKNEYKNAESRIKRAKAALALSDKRLELVLKYFNKMEDLIAPSSIYALDTAFQFIEYAHGIASAEDAKKPMSLFFTAFKHNLTVTRDELKSILGSRGTSLTSDASRSTWARNFAWALEACGAAENTYSGVALKAVTLKPEHELVQMLQSQHIVGELATN